ncbi:TetR/AcrR family transcriptional regulator [Ferrimonas sediminicola]|uniref:TetR/AcrR family transcriptional regulator n=1 Tax=Ferrimonas sediminicola TaxID=2569538 RepID=A0A4U1BKX8_9GAMM|nr:TetR/AcrR family transcriptional regulator [Ferrimonas sediminicola]TKB51464.1 TetR/AcrR family transcriptional regulator [Ferrimonas sediminicola]
MREKTEKYLKREEALLDAAAQLLKEEGLISFRFSQLAKRANCSMGALYTHFTNREDLLLALMAKETKRQLVMHTSVICLNLKPAETWLALTLIPFIAANRFSTGFSVLAELPQITAQASPERQYQLQSQLTPFCQATNRFLQRARLQGELLSHDKEISLCRNTVLCIQRGAMAFSSTPILGDEHPSLKPLPLYTMLFEAINTLRWRHPLDASSHAHIESALSQL